MRHCISFLLLISCLACNSSTPTAESTESTAEVPTQETAKVEPTTAKAKATVHTTTDYELHLVPNSKALLLLFPGGGHVAKHIKEEFKILPSAEVAHVSVALMNFNRHLWIVEDEAEQLATVLQQLIDQHQLAETPIFIGGMSMGGNVALSLSDHLHEQHPALAPKGVFMVDSPVDLYGLYQNAQVDLNKEGLSDQRLAEPRWIAQTLENAFGKENELLTGLEQHAPFTLATKTTSVPNLKQTQLRLYTEPDPNWWRTNRGTAHEQTNAYMIQNLQQWLKDEGWEQTELIQTKNRGYRANGDRHPHSWSIVAIDELLQWILS